MTTGFSGPAPVEHPRKLCRHTPSSYRSIRSYEARASLPPPDGGRLPPPQKKTWFKNHRRPGWGMNDGPSNRYESSLETFSVKVSGRWTTVRLEAELMAALRDVALAEGCDIGDICTRLAEHRRSGSLTSSLRLYILRHFQERAGEQVALGPTSELAGALDPERR